MLNIHFNYNLSSYICQVLDRFIHAIHLHFNKLNIKKKLTKYCIQNEIMSIQNKQKVMSLKILKMFIISNKILKSCVIV